MIIERIKEKRYVSENYLQYIIAHGFYLSMNKSRPALTSICNDRLYAEEIIKITIEESDKPTIMKELNGRTAGSVTTHNVLKALCKPKGIDAYKEYGFCDDHDDYVFAIGKPGFYNRALHASLSEKTFTFCVVKLDELKPLPLTKQEEAKMKVIKEKQARCKMNAATIASTLINILNDNGYEVYNGSNSHVSFSKIKGYNKLMKDALEYYLNNVIFKDMNVEISVPKVKNQHKYGFNDALFHFGDVIVKE